MPPAPRESAPGLPPEGVVGTAWFHSWHASEPVAYVDLREQPEALRRGGWWAVVAEFEGPVHAWRFGRVRQTPARGAVARRPPAPGETHAWRGPSPEAWSSSMDRAAYCEAVDIVREAIRQGEVYQANICRVLSAPVPAVGRSEPDAVALSRLLASGNPAPYAGGIHVPAAAVQGASAIPPAWVVTASPELSLGARNGVVTSRPIKGTGRTAEDLTEKDRAENLMITDLVRNDLQRVCLPGTVEVTDLLAVEEHPGLVHLVSTVRGTLALSEPSEVWRGLIDAALPAGSVSGAPKSSALRLIRRLEPVPRGPYCGAIGWIDADSGDAELAVGIRTFWWRDDVLRFGTGAGITWGSDPPAEWAETELKARRLISLASREKVTG
jgi:para-aminobenzoate synthetase component 1